MNAVNPAASSSGRIQREGKGPAGLIFGVVAAKWISLWPTVAIVVADGELIQNLRQLGKPFRAQLKQVERVLIVERQLNQARESFIDAQLTQTLFIGALVF